MNSEIINQVFPHTINSMLLKYDQEGLWSITLPEDADNISQIILSELNNNINILDGNAGLGGNTISFAKYFKSVTAIEIDVNKFNLLNNNLQVFNIKNVTTINDDSTKYLANYDAYFFDPPWGGPKYKLFYQISLTLGDYKLYEIVNIIKLNENKKIFFKLPMNYNLTEFTKYNYKIFPIKNYQIICIY